MKTDFLLIGPGVAGLTLLEETEQLYEQINVSPQLCELRNIIRVSYLVVKSAQFRKESRGLHCNAHHPIKAGLLQNVVL